MRPPAFSKEIIKQKFSQIGKLDMLGSISEVRSFFSKRNAFRNGGGGGGGGGG